jgi:hypothetical protein
MCRIAVIRDGTIENDYGADSSTSIHGGNDMTKYFVWTRDIERAIYETLSDKSRRLASNSDAVVRECSAQQLSSANTTIHSRPQCTNLAEI